MIDLSAGPLMCISNMHPTSAAQSATTTSRETFHFPIIHRETSFSPVPPTQNKPYRIESLMSQYAPPIHPADNVSLRPHYGKPMQFGQRAIKDTQGNKTGERLLLFLNPETMARYDALFDDDPNPPTTEVEAYQRCGATLFPHCKLNHCRFPKPVVILNV